MSGICINTGIRKHNILYAQNEKLEDIINIYNITCYFVCKLCCLCSEMILQPGSLLFVVMKINCL